MKRRGDFAVGDTFRAVREVDPYRPIYYAAASGDFNPIHVDPRVGRAAGFQGAILQGMCTYAWLADACVAYLDDPARVRRLARALRAAGPDRGRRHVRGPLHARSRAARSASRSRRGTRPARTS